MHRPELVYSFHRASSSRGRDDRGTDTPDERWKLGDSFIMVVAALRVLMPYVLVILATVAAAWGLWRLAFG